MDFEIGNILYIVITLVVVIVGLLGKKKKPQGQGNEGSDGEAKPGFLENLEKAFNMKIQDQVVDLRDYEEDLSEEEEMVEPAPELMSKPTSLMEEYKRLVEQQQEDRQPDTILSEADSITKPLEVVHFDDDEGTDYFEVIKDFDAGTAVVYSAIINRVYY